MFQQASPDTKVYSKQSWSPIQLQWVAVKVEGDLGYTAFHGAEPEHTSITVNIISMMKMGYSKETQRDLGHFPSP